MINRTLARIRVFQQLFAYNHGGVLSLKGAETQLRKSLHISHTLYLYLLDLVPRLTALHAENVERRRNKMLRTESDINPNLKMVNNRLAKALDESELLSEALQQESLSWRSNDDLLRQLLEELLASDIYKEYSNSPEDDFDEDVDFWVAALQKVVFRNTLLDDYLEDLSPYWDNPSRVTEKIEIEQMPDLDNVEDVVTESRINNAYQASRLSISPVEIEKDFALKTLRRSRGATSIDDLILPEYKSEDDELFPLELLRAAVVHEEFIRKKVEEKLKNWATDRLTDTDLVAIQLGAAELLTFPDIPAVVTINEYIELVKCFSTQKSGPFVNGILDAILQDLRAEKRLAK